MAAKHWTGLVVVLVLFLNVQVQGLWFNQVPTAIEVADDEIVQRDAVTCSSPNDCQVDECCLATEVRSLAKRSARTKRWFFERAVTIEGVCERLGTDGSQCVVPFEGTVADPTRDVIVSDMSPCAPEFICVIGSDIPIVVEQGEIGSCERKEPEPVNNDEVLQLLNNNDDESVPEESNDEDLTNNDAAPVADDNVDNNNNDDDADEVTPVPEEEEERADEWENTLTDSPPESEYEK